MLYEFYNTYTTPYRDKIVPNVMKDWLINEDHRRLLSLCVTA